MGPFPNSDLEFDSTSVVLARKLAFLDQVSIDLAIRILFDDRLFPGVLEDLHCFIGLLLFVGRGEILVLEAVVIDLAEVIQAVSLGLLVGSRLVTDVAL